MNVSLADMRKMIKQTGRLHQPGFGVQGQLPAQLVAQLEEDRTGEMIAGYIRAGWLTAKETSRPPKRPKVWASERHFQASVINRCDTLADPHDAEYEDPLFGEICHIANENAHRQPGVRGGMPDLWLPVLRLDPASGRIYGGLYIELKCGQNTCSTKQLLTIARLRQRGYLVAVVWDSVAEVVQIVRDYLQLQPVYQGD